MAHLNIEIKAKCQEPEKIREILKSRNALFRGLDSQTDTYFNCSSGRLKLREGNIENSLIFYEREDKPGPKQSNITLFENPNGSELKKILSESLGILAVVEKQREIYFIENIKFHIDQVTGLGSFVEIEAIDSQGKIGKEKLREQCDFYLKLFGISNIDLISRSYSDMVLQKQNQKSGAERQSQNK